MSPLEAFAGAVASDLVGRPVTVSCNSSGAWGKLAAHQRFDPVTVWGLVVFDWDPASASYVPRDTMQLSEAACWYLDQYWRAPASEKGRRCRIETVITFVGKKAHSTAKYGPCPDYRNRVFALQTISHESQHLTGIRDEATAECNGMQKLAWFARRFGATAAQGRRMAHDYYTTFYVVKRPGTVYYDPSCPDPGG